MWFKTHADRPVGGLSPATASQLIWDVPHGTVYKRKADESVWYPACVVKDENGDQIVTAYEVVKNGLLLYRVVGGIQEILPATAPDKIEIGAFLREHDAVTGER